MLKHGRKKTVQSKSVAKMAAFRKFKGLNIKYNYRDPKRHFLAWNDVFRRILRKNPFRGAGCSLIEQLKNEENTRHPKTRIWGAETTEAIATKFCLSGAVHAVITHANFGVDWLRDSAWRGVEFGPFPLTCFVAFTTRSQSHYCDGPA